MQQIKAIRGMHDILPNEISLWQYFECVTKNIFSKIGYKEIRLPIVEKKKFILYSCWNIHRYS
jgi:histidyl-tRNA synthetase